MNTTTKKILFSFLTALTVLLFAACTTQKSTEKTATSSTTIAQEVTIQTAQGEVTVPTNPKKVVTFDLGMADTIRAIGKENSIVGIPKKTLPAYLKDLPDSIQNVGTMKEPDIEAIAALEPDLIIASPRTEQYIDQLKEIAPTVLFSANNDDFWNTTKQNILSLASIWGDESTQTAKTELAKLDKEIQTISKANEGSDQKALTIMLNEGSMSAFGAKSRFSFLYDTLKFKPTDATIEESRHGQELSFESLKEINPDILFVLNRTLAIGGDNSANERILENALIQETTAAKNNHIIQLTSDLWYLSGGGIESTRLMLEDVQQLTK